MGTKKLILTFIIALILIGVFPLASSAAPGWFNVTVKQIGPASNGRIYVKLTDNDGIFTDKWFICSAEQGQGNRQMAIILTAMTNSLPILIYSDAYLSVIEDREIINLYMYSAD